MFEDMAARLPEDMARVVPRLRAVASGDSTGTDAHTSRTLTGIDPRESPDWP